MKILRLFPWVRSAPEKRSLAGTFGPLIATTAAALLGCYHLRRDPSGISERSGVTIENGYKIGALRPPYEAVQSPVVRIGPCLGAKIENNRYLFAAPCLYAGATPKLRLEFVAGLSTAMTVDNGEKRPVTIEEILVESDFDPMVSREELQALSNPRSRTLKNKMLSDLDAQFDFRDDAEPQSVNLALVKIKENQVDVPNASLGGPTPTQGLKLVMVSNFGCGDRDKESSTATFQNDPEGIPTPEEVRALKGPEKKFGPQINHDPAKILVAQKNFIFVEGAFTAYPKVSSLEPLCWGTHGSPIMTMTSKGFHLIGLGLARTRGLLIGARVDGPNSGKIGQLVQLSWLKSQNSDLLNQRFSQKHHLSCAQVLALLPDGSPREYGIANLEFALTPANAVTAAADVVDLAIEPHDRPPYRLSLDLAEYCTTLETLCYVGFYHDPITAGVQVVKLEVSSQGAALAHWISADGGARTTPLDTNSCQLTPLTP